MQHLVDALDQHHASPRLCDMGGKGQQHGNGGRNRRSTFAFCQGCQDWIYHNRIGTATHCRCGRAWPKADLDKAATYDRGRSYSPSRPRNQG